MEMDAVSYGVGIGINANHSVAADDVRERATSLRHELGPSTVALRLALSYFELYDQARRRIPHGPRADNKLSSI